MIDDSTLIKRVLNGDVQEFNFLVNKYINSIHHLVYSFIKDESNSDDVVQEIFIKTYNSLRNFKGISTFKTYLFRIAINECKLFFKKYKRKYKVEFNDQIQTIGSNRDNPEKLLENKILKHFFDKAIALLSPKLQTIIILKEREEMSYKEMSKVLDISIGTVESRLFLARKKLRELYMKHIKGDLI